MHEHDEMRCPECRTRRKDPRAFLLHVMACKRPVCHCMAYTYPHRPGSGECFHNPEAQMRRAVELSGDQHPLDVAADVAFHIPGKPMRAWPFDNYGALRMRERDIEADLVKRVKALGGEVRKVQWIGRRGAPDRLVMLPPRPARDLSSPAAPYAYDPGRAPAAVWVELKAPGKQPTVQQLREHDRMRRMGQRVEVIDSLEGVTELLS